MNLAQEFSYAFCEISKNTFSYRSPLVTASVSSCEFCKTSKSTFFTEHLRWLLLQRWAKERQGNPTF